MFFSISLSHILHSDDPPIFLKTFNEAIIEEGIPLSLSCVAAGSPLPQVTWSLDGYPVPDISRYRTGDYVTKDGRLVSYVNVSNVQAQGLFKSFFHLINLSCFILVRCQCKKLFIVNLLSTWMFVCLLMLNS